MSQQLYIDSGASQATTTQVCMGNQYGNAGVMMVTPAVGYSKPQGPPYLSYNSPAEQAVDPVQLGYGQGGFMFTPLVGQYTGYQDTTATPPTTNYGPAGPGPYPNPMGLFRSVRITITVKNFYAPASWGLRVARISNPARGATIAVQGSFVGELVVSKGPLAQFVKSNYGKKMRAPGERESDAYRRDARMKGVYGNGEYRQIGAQLESAVNLELDLKRPRKDTGK